jgi:hypothetical protein
MSRKAMLETYDTEIDYLYTEKEGELLCWRNGSRICTSQCIAWTKIESTKKIYCEALHPENRLMAVYTEEGKNKA